jgi:hypothetical protein
MDPTAALQQQAIGSLGVNLIYAAFHQRGSSGEFLAGLFDDLSSERLEIDVLELSGPVFSAIDSRLWCLESLRKGMCHCLIFDAKAQLVEPATMLHKRPLLVQRTIGGRPGPAAAEMIQAGQQKFLAEGHTFDHEPLAMLEVNTPHLTGSALSDNAELLSMIEQLATLGAVMVTNYSEGYQVLNHARRYTAAPVRVIIWLSMFVQLTQDRLYPSLPGVMLEGFGRLLVTDVTIYVAPMSKDHLVAALGSLAEDVLQESSGGELLTLDDLMPKPPLEHFFRYLRAAGRIAPLETPAIVEVQP